MAKIAGSLGFSVGDIQGFLGSVGASMRSEILDSFVDPETASAVAIYESPGRGEVCEHSGLIIALDGAPQWKLLEFGQIARQHGLGASIADAYRKVGVTFLENLAGPFSLAILDPVLKEGILSVDRMGVRSMYYAETPDNGLVFGSTLGACTAHPSIENRIDPQAIYSYLYFHMIPSPSTAVASVRKLPPASFVHVKQGSAEIKNYWKPVFSEEDTSIETLGGDTRKALQNSVSLSSAGDLKTGSFLSGGLDSSTVTGLLQQASNSPVPAYSVGFDAEAYNEIEYARLVAKHFGVRHEEYFVTPEDVVKAVPKIAAAYDEPFGNSSAVPTYYCAKRAVEDGTKVLLAGDGGDELFAGNERYAKQKIFESYFRIPAVIRKGLLEPVIALLPGVSLFAKAKSYVRQANVRLPDRLETYNYFHLHKVDEILTDEFACRIDQDAPLRLLRDVYGQVDAGNPLNRMLWLDWKQTLADNDLRKVNVMCDLAGVEVRYPMLDDEVVNVTTRIPSEVKLPGHKLRDFYKKTFEAFLPNEVITKSKHGFGLPFGVWMLEYQPLQELAYGALDDFGKRGIVKVSYLEQLKQSHKNVHPAYYGEQIWVFMMLEYWLQHHNYKVN